MGNLLTRRQLITGSAIGLLTVLTAHVAALRGSYEESKKEKPELAQVSDEILVNIGGRQLTAAEIIAIRERTMQLTKVSQGSF